MRNVNPFVNVPAPAGLNKSSEDHAREQFFDRFAELRLRERNARGNGNSRDPQVCPVGILSNMIDEGWAVSDGLIEEVAGLQEQLDGKTLRSRRDRVRREREPENVLESTP